MGGNLLSSSCNALESDIMFFLYFVSFQLVKFKDLIKKNWNSTSISGKVCTWIWDWSIRGAWCRRRGYLCIRYFSYFLALFIICFIVVFSVFTNFYFVYLGFDYEQTEVELEPLKAVKESNSDTMLRLEHKKQGSLLGFKPALDSEYKLER